MFTPLRRTRKKRLSLSPKKCPKPSVSDPYPLPFPGTAEYLESYDDENVELPLGFSFWDDARRCFKPITTAERKTLLEELHRRYPQIEAVTISIPFIIIECRESVPSVDQQIFMAARLVCVFMVEGERFPFGSEFIGYYGEGEMPSDVADHISCDIRPFHIPRLPTFEFWAISRSPGETFHYGWIIPIWMQISSHCCCWLLRSSWG
jgi:hypothetical protein